MPYKDTSAGAVAAGGLLRLSRETDKARATKYRDAAVQMLHALAAGYLSAAAAPPQPAAILANGTAHAMKGDWGTGTSYGDYYVLEALAQGQAMKLF